MNAHPHDSIRHGLESIGPARRRSLRGLSKRASFIRSTLLNAALASAATGCTGNTDDGSVASTQGGAVADVSGAASETGGSNAIARSSVIAAGGNTGAPGTSGMTTGNGGVFYGGGSSTAIATTAPSRVSVGGSSASGGASSGGTKSTGVATSNGGRTVNGVSSARGGTAETGGSSATRAAIGGATAKGGTTTASGATAKGGTTASGATAKGGASTGGASTSSGSTSQGGATSSANDLWIATDGSDSNPGTEASPFLTLTYAHSKVSAGQTIWIKPGTYSWSSTVKLTKNGTASHPIKVFASPGARPVIDFSGQTCGNSSSRGIQITGTYFHLKGFDVKNAGDNCIHIGGSYNTVEWVAVHGCCDSGLQITADTASDPARGAHNTILNCDAYENYDATNNGENADGFAPKLHIGPGNVFRGCRAWNNSDDGFDLFAADDAVVIDHCWAFLNGKLVSGGTTSAGDGNGFKLGGAAAEGDAYEGGAAHQVTNCFAFENMACGFTRNNNTSVPILTACGGRADGKGEYCSLTTSGAVSFTMTGAQAKAVARNADGSLPEMD